MFFNINFTPAAPAVGQTFKQLRVTLNQGPGQQPFINVTAAVIAATAVPQPDGSFNLQVEFPNPRVGPYTLEVMALDTGLNLMGSVVTSTGVVSLAQGVWFPQPVSVVAV